MSSNNVVMMVPHPTPEKPYVNYKKHNFKLK